MSSFVSSLVSLLLLLLFLEEHLLFDLLFVELLRWCQIEVVYDIRNIGDTIVWSTGAFLILHLGVLLK